MSSSELINHTMPAGRHEDLRLMAQGAFDYSVDARGIYSHDHGWMLCVMAQEGAIYITRAQAKAFFGLVEPSRVAAPMVAAVLRELEEV